ncbi:site-specific integrase [Virgibacillus senegalensis]|uniref:site-specific integrase n=1 Tax=Virgibacillus senegalensis TaxID=1499679 RepID=UPI00069F8BE6|nr:site-specific integrase [Virgibacillus senegalensis]
MSIAEEIDIDLDSLADESFDVETSIDIANENLKEFEIKFEEDVWNMAHHYLDHNQSINFNEFKRVIEPFGINSNELTNVIKCWVAHLLQSYTAWTVASYYHYLIIGLEKNKFFDESYLDSFSEYMLRESKYNDKTKRQILLSLLNFIDFYEELNVEGTYIKQLTDIKNKLNYKSGIRELPSSVDILKFSRVVDDYFENQNWEDADYIRYAPIYLWWRLTNIIPTRSIEFCLIKRNAVYPQNNQFYIKLTRKKQKKAKSRRNVQLINDFLIPEDLYDFIMKYIYYTEPFGESETLISYLASAKSNAIPRQINTKKMHLGNFQSLLNSFYQEVVHKDYGIKVEQALKPNDTRHLAFLNLLMQGIHPVEIARLGGHTTVRAQYHYFQHEEYWVDSEVEKLMSQFQFTNETKENSLNTFNDISINDKFRMLFKPSYSEKKLRIGYCTDELQRCYTDSCIKCKHWRIDEQELNEKRKLIQEELQKQRKKIDDLYAFFRNLHQQLMQNKQDLHPKINNDYLETLTKIKDEVHRLAQIKHNIRR